jgi:hypothetical protein
MLVKISEFMLNIRLIPVVVNRLFLIPSIEYCAIIRENKKQMRLRRSRFHINVKFNQQANILKERNDG